MIRYYFTQNKDLPRKTCQLTTATPLYGDLQHKNQILFSQSEKNLRTVWWDTLKLIFSCSLLQEHRLYKLKQIKNKCVNWIQILYSGTQYSHTQCYANNMQGQPYSAINCDKMLIIHLCIKEFATKSKNNIPLLR